MSSGTPTTCNTRSAVSRVAVFGQCPVQKSGAGLPSHSRRKHADAALVAERNDREVFLSSVKLGWLYLGEEARLGLVEFGRGDQPVIA